MKNYNVISAKNQGIYKEGELIQVLKNVDLNKYFGFIGNHETEIRYVGTNKVRIKES